jgi:hypothetical protein
VTRSRGQTQSVKTSSDGKINVNVDKLAEAVDAAARTLIANLDIVAVIVLATWEKIGRNESRSGCREFARCSLSSQGDKRGDVGCEIDILSSLESGSQIIVCYERCLN